MPYVVNFYRVSGIQKIYFNVVATEVAATDIWAATWYPTDYTIPGLTTGAVENYGDVNKFTYVKPLISVADCTDNGAYHQSTAAEFLAGTKCGGTFRIDAIINKLKQLPEGKRAFILTRVNQGPIYNELADRFPGTTAQSPWAEAAGLTISSDLTTIFTRFGASGATPDQISIDQESRGMFGYQYTGSSAGFNARVFGITGSTYYTSTWYGMTSWQGIFTQNGKYNFNGSNIPTGNYHPQTNREYLLWDCANTAISTAFLNKFVVEPIKAIFPNVKTCNYEDFIISDGETLGNIYDNGGHPYIRQAIVGDAACPVLYAGWAFPDSYAVYGPDTTRLVRTDYASGVTLANNSWTHALVMLQVLRGAKRGAPNIPLRPWIGSPYFSEAGNIFYTSFWSDSTENFGLWKETVRHIALHDVETIYYFNAGEDTSAKRLDGLTALNSILSEVNTLSGGYKIGSCVSTDRIDFLSEYLISGKYTNRNTYLWRVTPKPGIMLEHPDGTILDLDSDGGAWVETETSTVPTFYNTLNAPYEIVFKYLMNRYEPEWGPNSSTEGKTARASALGVSASYNPFGTTGGTAYQYVAYIPTPGASSGYFDPLSHPRLYAKAIEGCGYRRFGRARGHTAAKHRFIDDWNIPGTIGDVYYDRGGNQNTFYGFAPRYTLYPSGGETTDNLDNFRKENTKALHFNFQLNLDNKVERYYVHSPYGKMFANMAHYSYLVQAGVSNRWDAGDNITLPGAIRCMPWISNRYTAESFLFDMYLYLRPETCLRDFLVDPSVIRSPVDNNTALNAPFVGDPSSLSFSDFTASSFTYDIHLNTQYSGMTYPKGQFGATLGYYTQKDRPGGYTLDVNVGPPWIKFTGGFYWDVASGETQFQWYGANPIGMCFDRRTLVMYDGSTWGLTPPTLDVNFKPIKDAGFNNFFADYGPSDLVGLSFGYGQRIIDSWNRIADQWGNQVEFIGYFGTVPYGQGAVETFVPGMMYRDPTVPSNVEYSKWRYDAATSHWRYKFRSPHDGFARIIFENGGTQRTYHVYEAPGYTKYVNTLAPGVSFVDNIITTWSRDNYNYTYGPSGPNPNKGVILGTETFAQYNFRWDGIEVDPNNTEFTRYKNDPVWPSHWANDQDISHILYTNAYNTLLGQRKRGFTYTDSIWKKGVCGTSLLGEMVYFQRGYWEIAEPLDAYPFFHNTFINYVGGPYTSNLKWKRVPNTWFGSQTLDGATGGVPWPYDRRYRLFFLYPIILYLNGSIVDCFHSGSGYYNITVEPRPLSSWYDKTLGNTYLADMDYSFFGSHTTNPTVSNIPYPNRKAPTKPPQNNWNPADIDNSEFELLYSCMKGGLTGELDSLGYSDIYTELQSRGSTGFPKSLFV